MAEDEWPSSYLAELARALRVQSVSSPRVIEEVRSHLLDAAAHAERHGVPTEQARRRAEHDLGPPMRIAAAYAADAHRLRYLILSAVAVAVGAAAAFVDTRPHWDDTGVMAAGLFLAALTLGVLGPRRAWLWALCVGAWIPLVEIVSTHNVGSILALGFAFAGAYTGAGLRKLSPV